MLDTWVTEGLEYVDEVLDDHANQALGHFKQAIKRELETDMENLKALGFKVSLAVEFGQPTEQIIHFVKKHNIDLVVMATHGRKGLSRGLFGSVAEAVVRGLHIPILLVRPQDS